MSRVRAFVGLAVADQRRLVVAAWVVLTLRVVLAVGTVEHARRWAERWAWLAPGDGNAERVAWAVVVAGAQLPSSCLYEALAARALLARAGHDGRLHVGVVRDADFAAHAWVSVDGDVLVGDRPDLDRYSQLPAEEAF